MANATESRHELIWCGIGRLLICRLARDHVDWKGIVLNWVASLDIGLIRSGQL